MAAASLSHQYIPDRFLTNKAIDLIDETCAKLKNELTSKPMILDEIDSRIIQLEIERLSLQSDLEKEEVNVSATTRRLKKKDSELGKLQEESDSLHA